MLFIISFIWPWMLAAFIISFIIGWTIYNCNRIEK